MDAQKQETGQTQEDWEEETGEENLQQNKEIDPAIEKEEIKMAEETPRQRRKKNEQKRGFGLKRSSSSFAHGLAAGLGIGCIMAFVLMWIAVFFTPRLASEITYETMLATFIYPLIYLFALGLVALTMGFVSEHYTIKSRV